MPLTSIIDYFNRHLDSFNPRSSLVRHAGFHYLRGQVWATLLDRYLHPRQRNVFSTRDPRLQISEACLEICDGQGMPYPPESLYVLAWDREDVVFIDRFQRVLHALNHLAHLSRRQRPLVVDVHARHIQALSASHGWVFETLLERLGLVPESVMLRLDGAALRYDMHTRLAASSFHRLGYPLIAAGLSLDPHPKWTQLKAHGVRWVSPCPELLAMARARTRYQTSLTIWAEQAHHHGLKIWWPGLDRPGDLGCISSFEPDFVSGEWIERVITEAPLV